MRWTLYDVQCTRAGQMGIGNEREYGRGRKERESGQTVARTELEKGWNGHETIRGSVRAPAYSMLAHLMLTQLVELNIRHSNSRHRIQPDRDFQPSS